MLENWWDIPVMVVGISIGTWIGNALSLWIKRKLGWIE